jgi:hypothetical protein
MVNIGRLVQATYVFFVQEHRAFHLRTLARFLQVSHMLMFTAFWASFRLLGESQRDCCQNDKCMNLHSEISLVEVVKCFREVGCKSAETTTELGIKFNRSNNVARPRYFSPFG